MDKHRVPTQKEWDQFLIEWRDEDRSMAENGVEFLIEETYIKPMDTIDAVNYCIRYNAECIGVSKGGILAIGDFEYPERDDNTLTVKDLNEKWYPKESE